MTDFEDRPGIEPDPVEQADDPDWADYQHELEVSAFDRMMDWRDEEAAA